MQIKKILSSLTASALIISAMALSVNATDKEDEQKTIARVTAVDGYTITAEYNGMFEKPDGEEPPELPDGEKALPSANGDAAPFGGPNSRMGMPFENNTGADPSGVPNGKNGKHNENGNENTPAEKPDKDSKSITITLTDDTKITIEYPDSSKDGTIDDITVGTLIEVTLDDNGNAAEIIIRKIADGDTSDGNLKQHKGSSGFPKSMKK